MKNLKRIYKTNLSLLTDLYQLTMAYGYWKTCTYDLEAVFHLYFRRNPFGSDYTIVFGLEPAIEYLQHMHFSDLLNIINFSTLITTKASCIVKAAQGDRAIGVRNT